MVSTELATAVGRLRTASTAAEQLGALKHLKNQVLGHPVRKEQLVRHGIINGLCQILNSRVTSPISHSNDTTNGSHQSAPSSFPLGFDEVRLQALILLGSLAQGGTSILSPLIAASVEDILIASCSPVVNAPRIVSAALRASLHLFHAAEHSVADQNLPKLNRNGKWSCLATAQIYRRILSQTDDSPSSRHQVSLVCQIIQKVAASVSDQDTFCEAGILECLAAHLASHYVHNESLSSQCFGSITDTLPSSPSLKTLPEVLGAANKLIHGSKYRVARFLISPSLAPIFRFYNSQVTLETRLHQSSTYALYDINPSEMGVPCVHNGIQKPDSNFTKAFPALGSSHASNKNATLVDFADTEKSSRSNSSGTDNAITPWLIHLMRTDKSLTRVRAARLLAAIARTEQMSKAKSHTVALLVVPLLLDLMKSHDLTSMASLDDPLRDPQSQALSEAPIALSLFLEESSVISFVVLKAGYEGGIVKECCQYLKKTFETIENNGPLWSDSPDIHAMDEDDSPTRTIGERGISPKIMYLFRCREAGLMLIHGIANNRPGEDKYRKALVENGIIQYVVDSLTPFNAGSLGALRSYESKEKLDGTIGNPVRVLVAACKASKALSRSVYLLRTSLIDAGLAKHAYRLVHNPDIDVQVEALSVVSNMLVDCSPMRQTIIDDGAIPTLCMLAHSNGARIRAGSLRALMNLVGQAPSEIKRACCETLGMNWLVSVIKGEEGPFSFGVSKSSSPPHFSISAASNSMGERVSILHGSDDDEDMEEKSTQPTSMSIEDGLIQKGNTSGAYAHSLYSNLSGNHRTHETQLASIRTSEELEDSIRPAQELNQIEAHALDIIRNVVCGPGEQAMIDYVLNNVGHFKLYDLLSTKMQPLPNGPQMVECIPIKTLEAALKTLCHIAAGPPKYRADLIGQTPLLQLLLPLFYHPEPDIRGTCCWILNNLMWVDDSSDVHNAKDRASKLKEMGFGVPLEELSQKLADGGREQSQDVRERANAARDSMIQATEGRSARMADPTGLGHGVGLRA